MDKTLNAESFHFLLEELRRKCNNLLINQGIETGLVANGNTYMEYGYDEGGKTNPTSIKMIVFNYILERYGEDFFKSRPFHEKGDIKKLKEKFNGKLLYLAYRNWVNRKPISLPVHYLETYLFFLDVPTFEDFEKQYPNVSKNISDNLFKPSPGPTPGPIISENKLHETLRKEFGTSSWRLYSLSKNPLNRTQENIIRAKVEFGEFQFHERIKCPVRLTNPPGLRNYSGGIIYFYSQQLTFNMIPDDNSKVIYCSFNVYFGYFDNVNDDDEQIPLFIGIMTNVSSGTTLAYKVVLYKVKDSIGNPIVPKIMNVDDKNIPEPIQVYLSTSELDPRFIEVPPHIYNLKGLEEWLKDKGLM